MKKALIKDGEVVQVADATFPVDAGLKWLDCADDVKPGYMHDGENFSAPAAAPAAPKILTVNGLAALLVSKGVVTQQEIDGAKV